ncbi:HAD superfamily [Hirschfeldia incana]|nr:HAD superfamily [Hirschfeldia incana]
MMKIWMILLVVSFFSTAFSDETSDPYPSILQYPSEHNKVDGEEVNLYCTSWRFAAETNNLAPWSTIPAECADYVKDYLIGRGYSTDLERVSEEASVFASTAVDFSGGDGKDAWVFDIDETLLSNLPYYIDHGFGVELFDHLEFDKWVERGVAPAIAPSLKLYQRVVDLGYKIFLLTGRKESHRLVTVENLINAGFQNWDKLILRSPDEQHKMATLYKSEKRDEMVKEGYRIRGNSGDQWSDLLGFSMSQRSFKLPNPMYYIP